MNDLCDLGLKFALFEWLLWIGVVMVMLLYKQIKLRNLRRDCQDKELTIAALLLRERQLRDEIGDLASFVDCYEAPVEGDDDEGEESWDTYARGVYGPAWDE